MSKGLIATLGLTATAATALLFVDSRPGTATPAAPAEPAPTPTPEGGPTYIAHEPQPARVPGPAPWALRPEKLSRQERARAEAVGRAAADAVPTIGAMERYARGMHRSAAFELTRRATGYDVTAGVP